MRSRWTSMAAGTTDAGSVVDGRRDGSDRGSPSPQVLSNHPNQHRVVSMAILCRCRRRSRGPDAHGDHPGLACGGPESVVSRQGHDEQIHHRNLRPSSERRGRMSGALELGSREPIRVASDVRRAPPDQSTKDRPNTAPDVVEGSSSKEAQVTTTTTAEEPEASSSSDVIVSILLAAIEGPTRTQTNAPGALPAEPSSGPRIQDS